MKRRYPTVYNAIVRQVIAGAYNGKQLTVAGASIDTVASNQAWKQLQAIAFGGYCGVLEIEIEKETGAGAKSMLRYWYVEIKADGTFRTTGPVSDGTLSERVAKAFHHSW